MPQVEVCPKCGVIIDPNVDNFIVVKEANLNTADPRVIEHASCYQKQWAGGATK